MIKLKPIYDFDRYSLPIAKAIFASLDQTIFVPLFEILKDPNVRLNSSNALLDALRDGRLIYRNGFFLGDLNVALSKGLRAIGAKFNKVRKSYQLEQEFLPIDVKFAIREGNEYQSLKVTKAEEFLKKLEGAKIRKPNVQKHLEDTVFSLDKQFHATTQKITPHDLEIPLDPRFEEELSEAYTQNLDYYIQKWQDEQILRLRTKIHQKVSEGVRAESLLDVIKSERNVTYNKAKFLARQETSLMVSKYREIRYKDIGVNKYIWSTSHDSRVRHDHKELDGKVFSFDNPPVTDDRTGARNNPGEDFNCRCVAIPIVTENEFQERQQYMKEVREYAEA
ncbi:hypothetical protein EKK58_10170 [Candidatus Dependentiae bacterium]|nr:MAG: hypothetical protein EKK58_10170 [Candidatus Dependentiae bacterium]